MLGYRECVVAVIRSEDGKIFCGERSDRPGVWQLPQGGVDTGETHEGALFRELQEEIGCCDVKVELTLKDKISYDFPENLAAPIAKKFRGQIQTWYLLSFLDGANPSLEDSDGEFSNFAWKTPKELIDGVVAWKRSAYELGFKKLKIH